MRISCRRCRQVIGPDEPMVVIVLGTPAGWGRPASVLDRLEAAAGRWHFRCAPQPIREFAPVIRPPDSITEQLQELVMLAGLDRATIWHQSPDEQDLMPVKSWSRGHTQPPPALRVRDAQKILAAVKREGFLAFAWPDALPAELAEEWVVVARNLSPRAMTIVDAPCGGIVSFVREVRHVWADEVVGQLRRATRTLCVEACGFRKPML